MAEEAQDQAVADALAAGGSAAGDDSLASDKDGLLQANDAGSAGIPRGDAASGKHEAPVAASAAASSSSSSSSSDDVLIRFSTSHHVNRVESILTDAPLRQTEIVADNFRLQLPVTDAGDDVHLEGHVVSEIGHQRGVHTIESHFFSLRTVKSTGRCSRTQSEPPPPSQSAKKRAPKEEQLHTVHLSLYNSKGRRVLLWRKSKPDGGKWAGHADLLLCEVRFCRGAANARAFIFGECRCIRMAFPRRAAQQRR
jgi:hypothetical protein